MEKRKMKKQILIYFDVKQICDKLTQKVTYRIEKSVETVGYQNIHF